MPRPKKQHTVEELEQMLEAERLKSSKHYQLRMEYFNIVRHSVLSDWDKFKELPHPKDFKERIARTISKDPVLKERVANIRREAFRKEREQRSRMGYSQYSIIDVLDDDEAVIEYVNQLGFVNTYEREWYGFVRDYVETACHKCGVFYDRGRPGMPNSNLVDNSVVDKVISRMRKNKGDELNYIVYRLQSLRDKGTEILIDELIQSVNDMSKQVTEASEKIYW